jgi:isopenicillin-N epimerase
VLFVGLQRKYKRGYKKLKELFLLDPDIVFLNHGSFGACPRPVFEAYQEWQRTLERQPVDFMARRFAERLQVAREQLASYLKVSTGELVFIPNATTGINIVARSLQLKPGDEVLATNHEYGAIDRTWDFLCGKSGASYVKQNIPLPVTTPEALVEAFWQGVTPRTRVISLCHITSSTALIFPLQEICRRARARGILTIIDGAHAVGQIELDLIEVGADFYAGNCHKWLCAPKGAAFLFARSEVQALVEPFVVSWGWNNTPFGPTSFVDYLEWQGTRDVSSYLAVPAAIEFQATHDWAQARTDCHALLKESLVRLHALTGTAPVYPPDSDLDWYAQMAIVPLPSGCDGVALREKLWEAERIETHIIAWEDLVLLRVSVQAYNTKADIDALVAALEKWLPHFS